MFFFPNIINLDGQFYRGFDSRPRSFLEHCYFSFNLTSRINSSSRFISFVPQFWGPLFMCHRGFTCLLKAVRISPLLYYLKLRTNNCWFASDVTAAMLAPC